MALESVTTIYDLNQANPPGTDQRSQGDDHLRIIKKGIKQTFYADTNANKPSAGTAGRYYFETDTKTLWIDDGAAWVELTNQTGDAVTGVLRWTMRSTAASGWLFMNGDTLGHTGSGATHQGVTYQALFNVVKAFYPNAGTETWGVDTVTLTNLNSNGMPIMGAYDENGIFQKFGTPGDGIRTPVEIKI